MIVRFWGTRGSLAKAGPETVRYGGNTSCVEVRSAAGTLIVIDCGTGAHGLGQALVQEPIQPIHGHLLISHTHWDHIQGIPFFAPLFVPENEWDIYAPRSLSQSIRDTLAGQMQYTYFPVTIEALGAKIRYHDLVEGVFKVGDVTVRAHYLNHPALTLGYRLEAGGVSMVYACDHEPCCRQPSLDKSGINEQDQQHADFLRGADLVIHDAQYTASEYAGKIGWGHSTVEYAVEICNAVGVRQLALTHHDPARVDEEIDQIVSSVSSRLSSTGEPLQVFAAAEGKTIELLPAPATGITHGSKEFSATTPVTPAIWDYSILLGAMDTQTAEVIRSAAAAENVRLRAASDLQAILPIPAKDRPSLLIVDEQSAAAVELCRRVRESSNDATTQIPVVVVADRENPASGLAEFDPDWLIRPFSQQYARTRLRAWILRTTCRWIPAPMPENETQRQAALNQLGILDTGQEERFDRITRIASEAFEVPISMVSLVDRDRQWFKSCVGLDVKETPRDMAFCAHAILENEVLVVPDALLDPRFADNPLVTGDPHVRFYAGYPLQLADGHCIGTLCLIDTRPRQLDDGKINMLRDLGHLAEAELSSGPRQATA